MTFNRYNKVNREATRKTKYTENLYLVHVTHVIGIFVARFCIRTCLKCEVSLTTRSDNHLYFTAAGLK